MPWAEPSSVKRPITCRVMPRAMSVPISRRRRQTERTWVSKMASMARSRRMAYTTEVPMVLERTTSRMSFSRYSRSLNCQAVSAGERTGPGR